MAALLKARLRYELSGLECRDTEQQAVGGARLVLGSLRGAAVQTALNELLGGADTASKHAARLRLQLAEYALLKSEPCGPLASLLPPLAKHALALLARHRGDTGCVSSLAALLSSCLAKLLHDAVPVGGSCHPTGGDSRSGSGGGGSSDNGSGLVDAGMLCHDLLFPLLSSTYRDPEASRVAAGSVVLSALMQVLSAYAQHWTGATDTMRACLTLQLQLLSLGSLIERVPGVLQPACACLAVLGASIDRDTAKRMLLLALRGAVSKDVWQVRRDSLQALEALAAAAAAATAPGSSTKAGSEDAATEAPLVRLLAARKQHILQVLEPARYDRVAAVRAAAGTAFAQVAALPEVQEPLHAPSTPLAAMTSPPSATGAGRRSRWGSTPGCSSDGGRRSLVLFDSPAAMAGHVPRSHATANAARPRFQRPQRAAAGMPLDFGVQVFAPPPPLRHVPEQPDLARAESPCLGDQKSNTRSPQQFIADKAGTDEEGLRRSVDASSQTCQTCGPALPSPAAHSSPRAAATWAPLAISSTTGSWLPAVDVVVSNDQGAQHSALAAAISAAATAAVAAAAAVGGGVHGSPPRVDVLHQVQGRVEVDISGSVPGSPTRAILQQEQQLQQPPPAAEPSLALPEAVPGVAVHPGAVTVSGIPARQLVDDEATTTTTTTAAAAHGAMIVVPGVEPPAPQSPGDGGGAYASSTLGSDCSPQTLSERRSALRRQRQRWQLPAATGGAAGDAESGEDGDGGSRRGDREAQQQAAATPTLLAVASPALPPAVGDVGGRGSRASSRTGSRVPGWQGTRGGTASMHHSSLDLLRSVGARVQGLLESLSRQTSTGGSSTDGCVPCEAAVVQPCNLQQAAPSSAAIPAGPRQAVDDESGPPARQGASVQQKGQEMQLDDQFLHQPFELEEQQPAYHHHHPRHETDRVAATGSCTGSSRNSLDDERQQEEEEEELEVSRAQQQQQQNSTGSTRSREQLAAGVFCAQQAEGEDEGRDEASQQQPPPTLSTSEWLQQISERLQRAGSSDVLQSAAAELQALTVAASATFGRGEAGHWPDQLAADSAPNWHGQPHCQQADDGVQGGGTHTAGRQEEEQWEEGEEGGRPQPVDETAQQAVAAELEQQHPASAVAADVQQQQQPEQQHDGCWWSVDACMHGGSDAAEAEAEEDTALLMSLALRLQTLGGGWPHPPCGSHGLEAPWGSSSRAASPLCIEGQSEEAAATAAGGQLEGVTDAALRSVLHLTEAQLRACSPASAAAAAPVVAGLMAALDEFAAAPLAADPTLDGAWSPRALTRSVPLAATPSAAIPALRILILARLAEAGAPPLDAELQQCLGKVLGAAFDLLEVQ